MVDDSTWCPEEITWLAEIYAAGMEDIEALRRYAKWFETSPADPARVTLDLLISLEEQFEPQRIECNRPLVDIFAEYCP
jgi:hypothetical protein